MLFLAALVALTVTTGGVRERHWSSNLTSGFKIVYVSDTHYGTPLGDASYGQDRLAAMIDTINADDSVAVVILGGDHTSGNGANRTAFLAALAECNKPVLPIVGNWEWAADDTASGDLYDDFTRHYPQFYDGYKNANHRGKRWGAFRLRYLGEPTNCIIVYANNCRDTTAGNRNYYVNNPRDGSGVATDDFDGISDSTSVQRTDIQTYLRNEYQSGDWIILVWHRGTKKAVTISNRPTLEEWTGDADASLVTWIDTLLDGTNFVLLEGDMHQVALWGIVGNHYTVHSCALPRVMDSSAISAWGSGILAASLNDTAFADGGSLVDSLGADADLQDIGTGALKGYGIYSVLVPNATSMQFRWVLQQNSGDADSWVYTKEFVQ